MSFLDNTGLSYFYDKIKEKFIRSINSKTPDASGNVEITNVATADNLTSPDAQASYGQFVYRTSGGSASLTSGEAQLTYVDGNMKITGRVAENFSISSTNSLGVTCVESTWRTQISTSGTYVFNYTKPSSSSATTSWTTDGTWTLNNTEVSLGTYGLYVSNLVNPSVAISVREGGVGITAATIIPNVWFSQPIESGTYYFSYISDGENPGTWQLNNYNVSLSDYGISTTGTASGGDTIEIVSIAGTANSTITVNYTAASQGIITIPQPTGFIATGLNQFDSSSMIIENATFSNGIIASNTGTYVCYCKAIGGVTNGYVAYSQGGYITNIGYCATQPGFNTSVITTGATVGAINSSITFANNGYVAVVVSNTSDLCIHPKWSGTADQEYEAYSASTISFPTQDTNGNTIPLGSYGMPAVGAVADRLNLDAGTYVQRVGRLSNTTSNMEQVITYGTAYEYDSSYIYYVLKDADIVTYNVIIDPIYEVSDFGTEEFINTTIPVGAQILYGQNLRDKLRSDVLTISSQTLNTTQKTQALNNIGIYVVSTAPTTSSADGLYVVISS